MAERKSTPAEREANRPKDSIFKKGMTLAQFRAAQETDKAKDKAKFDRSQSALSESRNSNNFNQTLAASSALSSGSGTSNVLAMTLINQANSMGANTAPNLETSSTFVEGGGKVESSGASANQLRGAAAATLIGAEISKGYSQWANSQLNIMANNRQAGEIDQRASLITGEIFARGEQVQAKQAGAFVKSGVKLEGSALNVLDETSDKALDAAINVRREADFALGNIAMQTAVAEVDADFAAFNTVLGSAQGAAVAFG